MNLADVTVVLPTKNEAHNIARFLDSVSPGVRVIVVDASSDNTRDIIRGRSGDLPHMISDVGNIASARQIGAERAQTDWLLFSDADVVFAEDYFEILAGLHLSGRHGSLVGAKRSRGRYRSYYFLFSQCMRFFCKIGFPTASGSNMLVRREALLAVGGFDRKLSCNEDTELIWRIHRQGFDVVYEGRLRVYELDHRRLDRGVLRKTAHSLIRCALILFGWNRILRKGDWGYWRSV